MQDLGSSHGVWLPGAEQHHFVRPLHAVCITVYNEPLASLRATLHALVQSLSLDDRCPGAETDHACICIVVDGEARGDPALRQFLVDAGYLDSRPAGGDADITHHCSLHDPAEWMDRPVGRKLPPLRFIVSCKRVNRGKLHSHAVFFAGLCPWLEPTYCLQIDVGTVVEPPAIGAVRRHFDHSPDAGALATRVGCPAPGPHDGLLLRWQYMDFAVQHAAHWPAEVASGHLSVVPGQFCAFRWAALAGRSGTAAPRAAGPSSPLARYLRGMRPQGALETIMFLAEDRVIGNELVMAPGRPWRLEYCRGAEATTDPCTTLVELQRQRRRWNNCSYACRLWLLSQWPLSWRRGDRSTGDKLRLSCAMTWQLTLSMMQATAAASAVCATAAVGAAVWQAGLRTGALLPGSVLATGVLSTVLIAWTPRRRGVRGGVRLAAARDLVASAGLVLTVLCVSRVLPWAGAVLLFLPGVLCALLPLSQAPAGRRWQALRHVPEYLFVNAPMQLMLWAYSLAHLGDTSWGTKGLVDAEPLRRAGSAAARASSAPRAPSQAPTASRPLRAAGASPASGAIGRYRRRLTGAWVGLNAVLIAGASALPNSLHLDLNAGAALSGVVNGFSAALAVAGLIGVQIARIRRPGREAAPPPPPRPGPTVACAATTGAP